MAASGREAMAQGLTGLWQDMRLTSEPWTEFKLGSIAAPTLIWQVGRLVGWLSMLNPGRCVRLP